MFKEVNLTSLNMVLQGFCGKAASHTSAHIAEREAKLNQAKFICWLKPTVPFQGSYRCRCRQSSFFLEPFKSGFTLRQFFRHFIRFAFRIFQQIALL